MSSAAIPSESLADNFARNFTMLPADTEPLRERIFQLRCQVFCNELGYGMDQRDGLEADSYDARSLHCLLSHRSSGVDAGCVRLVQPMERGGGLPFEKFGLRHVDRRLLDWKQLDPASCCELSRLAVAATFRRRRGEAEHADGVAAVEDINTSNVHRRFPFIAISLYYAMIATILQRGYQHIFLVIEPRLQRHVARYGIRLRQVSPEFEYFGQRAVFYTDREQLHQEMARWRTDWFDLYGNVHQQLLGELPQPPLALASGQ
jgi:N-acyl amino acid synthase of PEP-CTERM/exosortase system